MVIKKPQATSIVANRDSTIWDYPLPTEDTGISYQNLTGRLPEKGWYKNTICRELIFIISGTATIQIEDTSYELEAGDLVILKPGQKHWGLYSDVALVTVTSPNWTEEQCEILEA